MQTSACIDCISAVCRTPLGGRWSRLARGVVGLVLLALTMGCGLPPISDGRPVPTNRLESLETGVSTKVDVRAALGEPRGNGMVRHTSDPATQRSIWYYEYIRMKDDQLGLKILLVFLDGDTYDGHLWFAAKELVNFGEH